MPVRPTVQEFLRVADVEYTVLPHHRAHTARQEAAAALIPVSNWAKVVIAFADGEPVQAVVPADCDVDFERLAALITARMVSGPSHHGSAAREPRRSSPLHGSRDSACRVPSSR